MQSRFHKSELLRGFYCIQLNLGKVHEPSASVVIHRTSSIELLNVFSITAIWQEHSTVDVHIAVLDCSIFYTDNQAIPIEIVDDITAVCSMACIHRIRMGRKIACNCQWTKDILCFRGDKVTKKYGIESSVLEQAKFELHEYYEKIL